MSSKNSSNKKSNSFLKSKKLGFILAAIQAIVTAVFIGLVIYVDMVPAKYLIPVIFLLVLFLGYDIFFTVFKEIQIIRKDYSSNHNYNFTGGIILCNES